MSSRLCKIYVTFLLLLNGCGHLLVRTATPAPCVAIPNGVLCADKTILFPDAGGYLCFDPAQIEPFFERYGK